MKLQRMITSSLASVTFAALTVAPSFGATTIGTTFNFTSNYTGFDSVGQTFTAPMDNTLDSFSAIFSPGQDPLTFSLYAWNGSTITGNALYASGPATGSTVRNFDTFSFTGINQTLTPGGTYVALFADTSKIYSVYTDHDVNTDPYAGGQLLAGVAGNQFFVKADDFLPPHFDMAFTANFSGRPAGVPEPGAPLTLGVFALGLVAIVLRARKTNAEAA